MQHILATKNMHYQQWTTKLFSVMYDACKDVFSHLLLMLQSEQFMFHFAMVTELFIMYYVRAVSEHVMDMNCTPWVKRKHGYNYVNSWRICKLLSLLQRAANFQQNQY